MRMMRLYRGLGLAGLLVAAGASVAAAQDAGQPSTACRLFPLACPGAAPPPPPPLLGPPDEGGPVAAAPAEPAKRRHAAHKPVHHRAKKTAG